MPATRVSRAPVRVQAFFNFGKKTEEAAPPPTGKKGTQASKTVKGTVSVKGTQTATKPAARKTESQATQILNAFDFSAARSKEDADLLYEAKYGKRGADGKMTPEQYAALRRKVGGTAKDYFKTWIEDEQPKNIKPYEKPADGVAGAKVPYLPFLIGVVLMMLVATVVVVQKTSS